MGQEREEVEKVVHSDDGFATVAYLRVRKASLVPKPAAVYTIPVPPLLEDKFATMASHFSPESNAHASAPDTSDTSPTSASRGSWVSVSNIQRSNGSRDAFPKITIEDEVTECFEIMKGDMNDDAYNGRPTQSVSGLLLQHNLQLSNCVIINIYLSSMDLFTRVNAVYSTFFGTSPPARACIAVDLPALINVRLDCLAFSEHLPGDRYALHVQGLSYWAPANIGPYSQAIMVCKVLVWVHPVLRGQG